jgi:hypothetical protein
MELEFFTICDYAADMGGGKLLIVGTFDSVAVKEFPAIQPILSVVGKVLFHKDEAGKHSVKVGITDPDGNVTVPSGPGEVPVDFPDGKETLVMNLILGAIQVKLPKAGKYTVSLEIDGQVVRTVYFMAKEK